MPLGGITLISDANPVQFWPINCDTYNESDVCGVANACFYQPFNCDDEIKVQITGALSGSYMLLFKNESGYFATTTAEDSSQDGTVWSWSFVPRDYGICDENFQLVIGTSAGVVCSNNCTVIESVNEGLMYYKSDPLSIKEFHNCTKWLEYHQTREYAGFTFEDASPFPTFGLRVPCRFFHERYPEEDDAIELTDSVIITDSQVKAQKLMEIQHVPYYFHRKMKLVLKHQVLEMDSTYWVKEEAYEIAEGNKRWPLKSATVWLTQKDSLVRNVL